LSPLSPLSRLIKTPATDLTDLIPLQRDSTGLTDLRRIIFMHRGGPQGHECLVRK
jgi:hypothetical protein